jgi:hypothetical protein
VLVPVAMVMAGGRKVALAACAATGMAGVHAALAVSSRSRARSRAAEASLRLCKLVSGCS